jgi:hypothetical protein
LEGEDTSIVIAVMAARSMVLAQFPRR